MRQMTPWFGGWRAWFGAAALGASCLLSRAADDAGDSDEATAGVEELLQAGQELWDAYAPPEVKAEYEFPTRASVEEFLATLQHALDEGSFEDMAAYAADARRALGLLRTFEGGDEMADWLEPRLDFLVASEVPRVPPPADTAKPRRSSPLTRAYWDDVVITHPAPARAGDLVPRLKRVFAAEGLPPEWAWIAEVESTMNPKARSPAGARGLFQFMPVTARRFGLSVTLPDERTDPEKSARAAARYLRTLHGQFASWPLALAAYNAGEGRVARAVEAAGARTYAAVARHLPAETRLYVPKVLATVAKRESIPDPTALPPPGAAPAG